MIYSLIFIFAVSSQERLRLRGVKKRARLTCVDFATQTQDRFSYTCADDGAVLCFVVDNLVFAVFDVVP